MKDSSTVYPTSLVPLLWALKSRACCRGFRPGASHPDCLRVRRDPVDVVSLAGTVIYYATYYTSIVEHSIVHNLLQYTAGEYVVVYLRAENARLLVRAASEATSASSTDTEIPSLRCSCLRSESSGSRIQGLG